MAELAIVLSNEAGYGILPVNEGYRKAREAAERALALDPNLAGAHLALAVIKRTYDWDWEGADVSFKRALALDPGNASILSNAGRLQQTLGNFDAAIALLRKATALDAAGPGMVANLGFALYCYTAGRMDESIEAHDKALELNPEPRASTSKSVVSTW